MCLPERGSSCKTLVLGGIADDAIAEKINIGREKTGRAESAHIMTRAGAARVVADKTIENTVLRRKADILRASKRIARS